jgi:hypothetical protein
MGAASPVFTPSIHAWFPASMPFRAPGSIVCVHAKQPVESSKTTNTIPFNAPLRLSLMKETSNLAEETYRATGDC